MKIFLGLMLALSIGALSRLVGIPVPAPSALLGALLVLAMTAGYIVTDNHLNRKPGSGPERGDGPFKQTKG